MSAYYNEVDAYAADWLRNLIAAGHIAPGDVDERSIVDVRPADLEGYRQCHFFAGIGVWSAALRGAGWPDDRPVWTGSCPCQPFSAAGRRDGFADERHLWPSWFHLIGQRRPPVVFGEQVASKAVDPWIDLVQADMEAVGYAFGAVAFPSAGVGAPHIRDRTYFVADASGNRQHIEHGELREQAGAGERWDQPDNGGTTSLLADADLRQSEQSSGQGARPDEAEAGRAFGQHTGRRDIGGVADATLGGRREERADAGRLAVRDRPEGLAAGLGTSGGDCWSSPTNGFWRDPDWLFCRDGKWRPVEPGTSPLAHGARSRVGRLRAYGNAINQKAAEAFIAAYAA